MCLNMTIYSQICVSTWQYTVKYVNCSHCGQTLSNMFKPIYVNPCEDMPVSNTASHLQHRPVSSTSSQLQHASHVHMRMRGILQWGGALLRTSCYRRQSPLPRMTLLRRQLAVLELVYSSRNGEGAPLRSGGMHTPRRGGLRPVQQLVQGMKDWTS